MVTGRNSTLRTLCEARTADAVRDATARLADELLDGDTAVFLVEDESGLRVDAQHPDGSSRLEPPPTFSSVIGRSYDAGKACVVDDLLDTRSAADPERSSAPAAATLRSIACVPIDDEGLLVVGSAEPARFTEVHLAIAEQLGDWAATALAGVDPPDRRALANGAGEDPSDPDDRLEEVADVLSHDLMNHLTVASGNLELAREGGDDRHFSLAATALERIEELVVEVVALARTGQLAQQTEPVDLRSAVEQAWAAVPTGSAECVVEGSTVVVANRSALCHLLENLFRNAVQHAGPTVTVRVGTLADGFYVADDGPGIPADDRDRVFESGFGGDDEGTGLGLTIVRRIVEAHGWSIRATESGDGGARFEVGDVTFH